MTLYNSRDYGVMLNDTGRVQAYTEALRRAITPGAVVVDIGTGTGFFALLACKLGAGRVFAIEPNPAIRLAQELAVHNGYADRIVFYRDFSFNVALPEPADVIISDLRSTLPLQYPNMDAIIDARRRFLKPGGVLIGQRDTLWAAGMDVPARFRTNELSWPESLLGLDLSIVQAPILPEMLSDYFEAEHMLLEPQCWAEIDYPTVTSPNVRGTLTWQAARSGTLYGFAIWFDALLAEGISFTNAPGQPVHVYRQVFFSLPEPVALDPGDRVTLKLWASLLDREYLWTWHTSVTRPGAAKAEFRQSTLLQLIDSDQDTFPVQEVSTGLDLNEEGLIARLGLDQAAAGMPLDEIASLLVRQYPARFADLAAARATMIRFAR